MLTGRRLITIGHRHSEPQAAEQAEKRWSRASI
jgi:hypothetical protein